MAVRRKGRQYQADFMFDRKRYRQSFATEQEAEAWEHEARAALKRGNPVPTGPRKLGGGDAGTLANVLRSAETLHWGRLRNSGKSIVNARVFVEWAGPKTHPQDAFTAANIRAFVRYLIEDRKVSNTTINRYSSVLSVLIRFADLKDKPELPWFKKAKSRVRFFSPEEERAIIALLSQWDRGRYRDLFMFLLDTGLRPWSEAVKIEWANVRSGKVSVLGKNGEWRDVPLTRRAAVVLDRQPREDKGPFTSINPSSADTFWSRVRAHVPSLSDTVWYTARHTFASRLVQSGKSLKAVAMLMGNSTAIVDKVYAHLAPDHLKDAVSALEVYGEGAAKLRAV